MGRPGDSVASRPYAVKSRLHPFYGAGNLTYHRSYAKLDAAIRAAQTMHGATSLGMGGRPEFIQYLVYDARSGHEKYRTT